MDVPKNYERKGGKEKCTKLQIFDYPEFGAQAKLSF